MTMLLRMSLLLALLAAAPKGHVAAAFHCLVLLALFFPKLGKSHDFWLAITSLQIFAIFFTWGSSDNHKYLIAYWFLTLYLALLSTKNNKGLLIDFCSQSARYLIAGAMLFAVLAKLIHPEYINGDFFRYTLLMDGRFKVFTLLFTGVDKAVLEANGEAMNLMRDSQGLSMTLQGLKEVNMLAIFLTWWTVLIEALIGFLFLWNKKPALTHVCLIVFMITTYSVATVTGFSLVLCCLGYAHIQNQEVDRRLKLFYPCFFAFTFVLGLSFGDIL
jgi:hypothetical protein